MQPLARFRRFLCAVFLESRDCGSWFYTGQANAETRSWGEDGTTETATSGNKPNQCVLALVDPALHSFLNGAHSSPPWLRVFPAHSAVRGVGEISLWI